MKKFLLFVLLLGFIVGCGSEKENSNRYAISHAEHKDLFILHNMSYRAKYSLGTFFLDNKATHLEYSTSMSCKSLGFTILKEESKAKKFDLNLKYYDNEKGDHCGEVDFSIDKILAGKTGFAVLVDGDYFHGF